MLALIMAGGQGLRLRMGETPGHHLRRPMLSYVIDAFEAAGHELSWSPRTGAVHQELVPGQGITCMKPKGLVTSRISRQRSRSREEGTPLFTCVSDLPCLVPDIITGIEEAWRRAGTPACSTWCSRPLRRAGLPHTVYRDGDGTQACPAGINILTAGDLEGAQEELQLLLHDRRLVFNINTREELHVQEYLCRRQGL